jgi:hypothetical protein
MKETARAGLSCAMYSRRGIEVRFYEAGQLDPHYDRAWSVKA